MRELLPDDLPRTLAIASGLGAASSSCSYASVASARSRLRRSADFTSAMAFQLASTNLVVQLGIILAVLIGWQCTAGKLVADQIMIAPMALLFRRFLKPGDRSGGTLTGQPRRPRPHGGPGRDGHQRRGLGRAAALQTTRRCQPRGPRIAAHPRAIHRLLHDCALSADVHPDRLRFTRSLRVLRRSAPACPGFPTRTLDLVRAEAHAEILCESPEVVNIHAPRTAA